MCPTKNGTLAKNLVCPVRVKDQPGENLPDIESLNAAIQFLNNKKNDTPYFLAVGFHKPHVPLKYPREYLGKFPIRFLNLYCKYTRREKLKGQ